jgi:pre-rRNA-processing protein IPI1
MNVIFCDLASLLVQVSNRQGYTQPQPHVKHVKNRHLSKIPNAALHSHVERVGEYVILLLNGESIQPQTTTRPLSVQAYSALLPSIWSLLNSASHQELSDDVFEATVNHAIRVSSMSSVKRLTLDFLSRLALVSSPITGCCVETNIYTPLLIVGYGINLSRHFQTESRNESSQVARVGLA